MTVQKVNVDAISSNSQQSYICKLRSSKLPHPQGNPGRYLVIYIAKYRYACLVCSVRQGLQLWEEPLTSKGIEVNDTFKRKIEPYRTSQFDSTSLVSIFWA